MVIKMEELFFANGVVKKTILLATIRETLEKCDLIYLDFTGINSIFELEFRELLINLLSDINGLKKIKIINAKDPIRRTLKLVINSTERTLPQVQNFKLSNYKQKYKTRS